LVLDEVAVSDVVRTEEELRRDAFVAPLPSTLVDDWPDEAPALPTGLDPADVFWPQGVIYSSAKVNLGRRVSQDPILSAGTTLSNGHPVAGTVSCSSCHESAHSFAETLQTAASSGPGSIPFNTPTLVNAAFGTHKMFDGRAASIE